MTSADYSYTLKKSVHHFGPYWNTSWNITGWSFHDILYIYSWSPQDAAFWPRWSPDLCLLLHELLWNIVQRFILWNISTCKKSISGKCADIAGSQRIHRNDRVIPWNLLWRYRVDICGLSVMPSLNYWMDETWTWNLVLSSIFPTLSTVINLLILWLFRLYFLWTLQCITTPSNPVLHPWGHTVSHHDLKLVQLSK